MQVKLTKKIGDVTLELNIEGSDLKDALFKASFLWDEDAVPKYQKELADFVGLPVYWKARKTKEGDIIYVERKCYSKDGRIATSTLGSYKQGGYFWHQWEIYNPDVPKDLDKPRSDDY
jgi:hypothetical protein